MNWMPLYDKIVIKNANKQEIKSESGLTYTRNMSISTNTTLLAEVVAVGEGRLLGDGTIIPLKVKVGDKVLYSKHQGESFDDGKEQYTILSESGILAIIQEEQ